MPVPFTSMPAFPSIVAGTTSIAVARNKTQTLAAGSYGDVHVGNGATLTLTGGLYKFKSLVVDQSATVLFAAQVELRIAGTLGADSKSNLKTGTGVRASQVVIYVGGTDTGRDGWD